MRPFNVYREWVKVREIQSVDMMADIIQDAAGLPIFISRRTGIISMPVSGHPSVINHCGCRMTAVICNWRGVID